MEADGPISGVIGTLPFPGLLPLAPMAQIKSRYENILHLWQYYPSMASHYNLHRGDGSRQKE